jgi:type IV pilus assembly protein PilA
MNETLSKLREKRAKGENGFTLIELLVVVVILGVLIAIAVPVYLNYRKGANDAAAESDMRNAVNTLEQCYTENGKYPSDSDFMVETGRPIGRGCNGQTINLSKDTSMVYRVGSDPVRGGSYTIVDRNANGSGKSYCYNSTKGGQIVAMGTPVTSADQGQLNSC